MPDVLNLKINESLNVERLKLRITETGNENRQHT